jgi:hypothetical protein
MKKTHRLIAILLPIHFVFNHIHAQTEWDINGNNFVGGEFLGSTAGNFPLVLRTTPAQPIVFQTNGATERMRLTPTGEIGLGTTTPASFMHLSTTATGNLFRTDGAAGNINRWQLFTGGVEKFRLSVPAGSSNVYLRTANLSTTESSNFYIQTGGTLNRLKINGFMVQTKSVKNLKTNSILQIIA